MPTIVFNQQLTLSLIENEGDELNEEEVEEEVERGTSVEVKFLRDNPNDYDVDIELGDGSRAYSINRSWFEIEVPDHEKLKLPPITPQQQKILILALGRMYRQVTSDDCYETGINDIGKLNEEIRKLYGIVRDEMEKNDGA